jgi:hypothetical protein
MAIIAIAAMADTLPDFLLFVPRAFATGIARS